MATWWYWASHGGIKEPAPRIIEGINDANIARREAERQFGPGEIAKVFGSPDEVVTGRVLFDWDDVLKLTRAAIMQEKRSR